MFLFARKINERKERRKKNGIVSPFAHTPQLPYSSTIQFHANRLLFASMRSASPHVDCSYIFVSRFAAHRSRIGFSLRQWTLPSAKPGSEMERRRHSRSGMPSAPAHAVEFEYSYSVFLLRLFYISLVLLSLRWLCIANSILHCRCNISLLKTHREIITVKMIIIIIINFTKCG